MSGYGMPSAGPSILILILVFGGLPYFCNRYVYNAREECLKNPNSNKFDCKRVFKSWNEQIEYNRRSK